MGEFIWYILRARGPLSNVSHPIGSLLNWWWQRPRVKIVMTSPPSGGREHFILQVYQTRSHSFGVCSVTLVIRARDYQGPVR